MSHNRAFWKAFHSLTHPLSLLAIMLLLFNDHWLRYAHPSWLTGKLGDFTWLLFAPFITGLVFAWIVPRRLNNHTKIVGMLSIGFIGVWFATAKTIPFVHHLTTETLYAIVGWEGQLRLDITDLLTLPALIISWYIWKNASDSSVSLKPLGYIALGLGLLGTMASDGPSSRDYGIREICNDGGALYTKSNDIWSMGWHYGSTNGGLFWKSHTDAFECPQLSDTNELIVSDNLQIRWTPDESIEASYDDGTTWIIEHDLPELEQEIRVHLAKYGSSDYSYLVDVLPSPTTAHYDEDTGNVIFAMSHNGVLVRQSDGAYTWVTVGDYGLDNLTNIDKLSNAIFFELWLTWATIFLVVTTSTLYIRRKTARIHALWMFLSWAGYGGILFLLIAERSQDLYLTEWSSTAFASLIMFVLFGIPLSIGTVWDILNNFRSVALNIALASIGTGLLFVFPFLLWTQGRIPPYATAYGFSLLLTVFGLYASWMYLKRVLPTVEPEKFKNEDIEKNKPSMNDIIEEIYED